MNVRALIKQLLTLNGDDDVILYSNFEGTGEYEYARGAEAKTIRMPQDYKPKRRVIIF